MQTHYCCCYKFQCMNSPVFDPYCQENFRLPQDTRMNVLLLLHAEGRFLPRLVVSSANKAFLLRSMRAKPKHTPNNQTEEAIDLSTCRAMAAAVPLMGDEADEYVMRINQWCCSRQTPCHSSAHVWS